MSEVKRIFNPEFLKRLDEIILFDALTEDDLSKIIDMLMVPINKNLAEEGIAISLDPAVKGYVIEKTCKNRSYGARPLRRALQKYIEDPIAEYLIQGKLKHATRVLIYLKDGRLYFKAQDQDTEEGQLLQYELV